MSQHLYASGSYSIIYKLESKKFLWKEVSKKKKVNWVDESLFVKEKRRKHVWLWVEGRYIYGCGHSGGDNFSMEGELLAHVMSMAWWKACSFKGTLVLDSVQLLNVHG